MSSPWLLSNELINIYFKLLNFNFDSIILIVVIYNVGFPSGSVVKNPPAMQETWIQSLGREDSLEREIATHSSIPAWKIPWREEDDGSGSLQPMGSIELNTIELLENNNNNLHTNSQKKKALRDTQ